MARKRNDVSKKVSPKRKAQRKRRLGHDELIAQLAADDSDPGNERSVTYALLEERRSGPADLDEVLDQFEIERDAFHRVLADREHGEMPYPEEPVRRRVVGPLNHPLIEAYERLYARLNRELNAAPNLYERLALSQATRALINAIETERLIHSPYEK